MGGAGGFASGGERQPGAERASGWLRLGVEAALVFALSAVALAWIVAGAEGILGVDGYYHFRVAEEIVARGPWVDISWLPFTVLGDRGPDHHWLFHLLIAPFTLLGHSLTAVKWAAVFCAALIPTTVSVAGRLHGIRYAPLFALLAITTSAVLPGRYLMLRANGLALVFTLLAVVAMTRRRYWLLGMLAFLFMQFYHGALILVPFAGIWLMVQWVRTRVFESRIVVAVGSGLFLGLLLSPWFPDNVGYLVFHTLFKVGNAYFGLIGTEWYPTVWPRLLRESWAAHGILAAATSGALWISWRKGARGFLQTETILYLIIAFLFLALYKSSWRFVDYYAPFACVAAGLVLRDCRILESVRFRTEAVAIGCGVALAAVCGWQSLVVIDRTPKTLPSKYGDLATYLDRHAEPGDVVLNSRWTDFVQLVWHSPQFRYVSGLDGHYLLYGDDSSQFDFWLELRDLDDLAGEDVSRLAIERFEARWMVVPRFRDDLAALVRRGAHATQVHADEDGWLFRLDRVETTRTGTEAAPTT